MKVNSIDINCFAKFILQQSYIFLLIISFCLCPILLSAQSIIPLKDFLFKVEDAYQISIIYNSDLVNNKSVDASFNAQVEVEILLNKKLYSFDLECHKISKKVYVVVPKKTKNDNLNKLTLKQLGRIKGRIRSRSGEHLEGVNITIFPSAYKGTYSKKEGIYQIDKLTDDTYTVEVSHIGYVTQRKTVNIEGDGKTIILNFFLAKDLLELHTVIVTGVQTPASSIQSSIAATNITADEIDENAPRSVADILQTIPGFYVESSGGEVTNNLFSRGMSAEGSYQYVALLEDGLPIYDAGNVDWVAADNYFRIDNTIQNIEAIRGGSAGVFASNAPGGLINFVSKTGGKHFEGLAKLQISDFGQLRTEFNVGGASGLKYRYNIGGFYREDDGIRSPGFKANRGGQLKGNITRLFNKGFLRISGKYLNDRNIFYLPIPLKNTIEPEGLSFFDPNYGTMTSANLSRINFPTPEGSRRYDLDDGVHTKLSYIGSHFSYDVGEGWQINNRNRFSFIEKGNNSIISIFNPMTAENYAQQFNPDTLTLQPIYSYRDDGSIFNPLSSDNNGLVVEAGWWANRSSLFNFINSLEITKTSKYFDFTGGMYASYFTKDTQRNWANVLLEVKGNQPRALNLDFVNLQNEIVYSHTHEGYTTYQAFDMYQNSFGNAWTMAGFAYGTYRFSNELNVDGGLRVERLEADGSLENSRIYDLNYGDTFNPVLANIRFGDSTFTSYSVDKTAAAWSLGMNHAFHKNASYFIRVSDGYRMPDFDNWERGQSDGGQIERVFQLEAGLKYTSSSFAFFTAGFMNQIQNQLTTDISIDADGNILPLRTRGSQTIGIEIESIYNITKDLQVDFTATIQQAHYRVNPAEELNPARPIDGNQVKRIPSVFYRIRPSYKIGDFKLFGTLQYIGNRYGDELNSNLLPAFTSIDTGMSFRYKTYQFLLQVQNATNVIGLTEGNPRIIGADVSAPTRMARPILGRSLVAYISYEF